MSASECRADAFARVPSRSYDTRVGCVPVSDHDRTPRQLSRLCAQQRLLQRHPPQRVEFQSIGSGKHGHTVRVERRAVGHPSSSSAAGRRARRRSVQRNGPVCAGHCRLLGIARQLIRDALDERRQMKDFQARTHCNFFFKKTAKAEANAALARPTREISEQRARTPSDEISVGLSSFLQHRLAC